MSIYDETGIKFPPAWIYVYEVCADRGYGAKIATFEQLNTVVVKAEMAEVINNKRTPEAHHNALSEITNRVIETPVTKAEWIEILMEQVGEINSACKYED